MLKTLEGEEISEAQQGAEIEEAHFLWDKTKVIRVWEPQGPGTDKQELLTKVHMALSGTSNTSAPIFFIFLFLFYSHLTPHSPTGMAGGSPRLTNTCTPTTTAASYKGTEQTIGPKGNTNPVTRQTEQVKSTERKGT